jgi:hypothetical protein
VASGSEIHALGAIELPGVPLTGAITTFGTDRQLGHTIEKPEGVTEWVQEGVDCLLWVPPGHPAIPVPRFP